MTSQLTPFDFRLFFFLRSNQSFIQCHCYLKINSSFPVIFNFSCVPGARPCIGCGHCCLDGALLEGVSVVHGRSVQLPSAFYGDRHDLSLCWLWVLKNSSSRLAVCRQMTPFLQQNLHDRFSSDVYCLFMWLRYCCLALKYIMLAFEGWVAQCFISQGTSDDIKWSNADRSCVRTHGWDNWLISDCAISHYATLTGNLSHYGDGWVYCRCCAYFISSLRIRSTKKDVIKDIRTHCRAIICFVRLETNRG